MSYAATGNYQGAFGAAACTPFTDYTTFTATFKNQLQQLALSYMDTVHNTFFWTWKIANSTQSNLTPNPVGYPLLDMEYRMTSKTLTPLSPFISCGITNSDFNWATCRLTHERRSVLAPHWQLSMG
jgi:hypothetical protein